MGCLKLSYYQTPELKIISSKNVLTLNKSKIKERRKHKYGFNGKEKDDDITGSTGAIYDYGFRIYDSRIARFLSVDPLTKEYPWYTPYQFAGNMPTRFIDLDGLEPSENPQTPGVKEKKAMAVVNVIEAKAAKNDAKENFFSRSAWLAEDMDIKGTTTNGPTNYVSDTHGDPDNDFNLKVDLGATTLNVDESQASHTNNYEAFIVNRLLKNFVSGEGPTNYNFPTNGIISSKFLSSDILKSALKEFNAGQYIFNKQYSFQGGELAGDILRTGTVFSSITGFAGSGSITMIQTDKGVQVQIFNITSLYSGDLGKDIIGPLAQKFDYDKEDYSAKSYVRDPNRKTPYGNISQTFNLFIPNNSPLLKK
jgi:RHS repeat-associated protein